MKVLEIIARVLLGLVFVFFGSNAFFNFLHAPPMSGPAGDFINAMIVTGYVKVVGFCQVAGGLLLLVGRFIPLGLTLLGPVIVNILCYHIFLNHEGWPIAAVVAGLTLFVLWRHRANFAGLLRP
ncbi:MAG TPA: DoxX family membrane protein [Verrucomicrobiae bacterium]|nr:DoxX family membrane protein [Verrucomicrobiae bacterium]